MWPTKISSPRRSAEVAQADTTDHLDSEPRVLFTRCMDDVVPPSRQEILAAAESYGTSFDDVSMEEIASVTGVPIPSPGMDAMRWGVMEGS